MRLLPQDMGTIHFVGIGGIGMSGIAEVLHNLGYKVQGSDIATGVNVRRLKEMGIKVNEGHSREYIGDAEVVVISSAVKLNNPEIEAARERLKPIVRRAEMLGELMRLKRSIAVGGTHGKTTTTSMIAALFDKAELDPTVINGGIINAWGSNARLGNSDWMIVEADESDGTFTKLPAAIAVVTNINSEHMDHYGSFESLRTSFDIFVENIPFDGFAVLCMDDPEVQAMIPRISDRKIVTYGASPQADIRMKNLKNVEKGTFFEVVIEDRNGNPNRTLDNVFLPMHGAHNVQNALAAIAVANEVKISDTVVLEALSEFAGVKRRFTKTGEVDGISIIDDYGHHPAEIAAVILAARSVKPDGSIIAVVQPHRYTRLRDLFEEFCTCLNEADIVIVTDIYPAGEKPIQGINKNKLANGLRSHGHRHVVSLDALEDLAAIVDNLASSGDMVVCLGAGDITNYANSLPKEIAMLRSRPNEEE